MAVLCTLAAALGLGGLSSPARAADPVVNWAPQELKAALVPGYTITRSGPVTSSRCSMARRTI
jgi:hypothetical protein